MNIVSRPIQAHGNRGVHKPLVFVLHGTAATCGSAMNTFSNPANKKSATMIVTRKGEKWHLVPIDRAPYTNGKTQNPLSNLVKSMPAGMNINLISLTIEMEEYEGNGGKGDITEEQFWAVIESIKWMQSEVKRIYNYNIPLYPDRIIGHHQIDSKGKPNCPGPLFPWNRLYSECAKITDMSLDDAEEYIHAQQDNIAIRAYTIAARVDQLAIRVNDPKWGASAVQKLSWLYGIVEGVNDVQTVASTIKTAYAAKDYETVLKYEKTMKDKALI